MRLRRFLLVFVAVGVIACSDQRDAEPAYSSSPLASIDRDRLYLLLRTGGGVKPVCSDYFGAPTSPQIAALNTECQAWELAMLDHLRLNGITDLEPKHLEDPTFWRWWAEAQSAIARCRKAVREHDRIRRETKAPGWRLPDTAAFRNCDPFDKAIQGEGKTLADIGIVRARVSVTEKQTEP